MESLTNEIIANIDKELATVKTKDEFEKIRIKYVGRKGQINDLLKNISGLPLEERKTAGQLINKLKNDVASKFEKKKDALTSDIPEKSDSDIFDVTLPGKHIPIGNKHPLTKTIDEIKEIFGKLGFDIAYGPEIENEYYNFDALNIPANHASRVDFDTFYIDDDVLLRSQTSTVQIRIMEKQKPPIRIIAPGKVFRPDTVDARHSFMFHQIEGLMVDEGINFADLKAILNLFVKAYFGSDIKMRFRPSFFPFTEPSAEIDISCSICKGKGCSVCSYSGWVEILGAGMVDPNVFKSVGYDDEKFSGFAFGMGVERVTMLKYGINDVRLFFENDIRFLSQFR
ncbi:MAG: phenylalanine--tRNA ligase subunit alpha [Candidatus Anammoxibacter sp.]